MKIDAHTHVGAGRDDTPVEALEGMLDEYQLDGAILFPPARALGGSPRMIAAANDYLAEVTAGRAGRLAGFCTVNPYHEQEAWDELARVAKLGLRGLKLHPPVQGFVIGDLPLLRPIFERIRELGWPTVIHTGLRVAGLPYVLVTLADVGTLASAFPTVPIVVAHSGWGGRDSRGADVLAREFPNVWFDTAGVNMPSFIRDLAVCGAAQRIMFGSDFPLLHPKVERLRVELAELPAELEAAVMGGNAARLLGWTGGDR